VAVAERLFLAVRDGIRYDPYRVSRDPAAYRAGAIAQAKSNWCVPKSVLLAACARRAGIPARLGFADVVNHLSSERLRAAMGTDVFAWHGYAELWLNGRWVKLSTAFNRELCERFGVRVLAFDAIEGALMHPFDEAGNRHMEYVRERGCFPDLPLDAIFATFDEVYPGMQEAAGRDTAFHD
jgi:transglutaminase-like putative cysteine protease